MAINTTTFESRLQAKFDSTTDPKEMLLLGKALESTVGSIAVSNVQTEGTTQVARVVASMTGALPDQSGQSGKVLTSDGTNSTWQEGLPSQSGQGAKFLTTNGTSANWEALSSSALSANFEVEVGKTVSTGDVVNYAAGKIGDNPVVNTQGALHTSVDYGFHSAFTSTGKACVRAEANGSGHHQVRVGVVQTDGTINWGSATTLYTGQTSSGTSVIHLGSNKFVLTGSKSSSWGSSSSANAYCVYFTVSDTGVLSNSSTRTFSMSGGNTQNVIGLAFAPIDKGNKVGVRVYRYKYHVGGEWPGYYTYYETHTFTNSGSISSTSAAEGIHEPVAWEYVASNSKVLGPRGNAAWKIGTWNGSTYSNDSTIHFDTAWSRGFAYYKPDASDIFVCMFVDSSNVLKLNTYSYSGGVITKTNDHSLNTSAADIDLGNITGIGNNIVLGYEYDSKGYVASFTLNASTKAVEGVGLSLQHNSSNKPPLVSGPYDTNKYSTSFNNSASRAVNSLLTVNAYATSALNWLGVARSNGTAGTSVGVTLDGIASGFTGLIVGSMYYYNTSAYDGSVTLDASEYLIGTAVSATEIKLNA